MDLELRTREGGSVRLPAAALDSLRSSLRGELITAAHNAYDDACSLWNAMIEKRPALIARCSGQADVIDAVNFARENSLLCSIRSAGHNIAGSALCDGGFVMDLSRQKGVRVDPDARRAWVQPGACWGDVDRESQIFGLAAPGGIVSTTGVAGLTLGGGFGWLTRKHGLTVDSLAAVTIVTADGRPVAASETQNAELFWAIRGGGGNFGVVTTFEYRLHSVGPNVIAGMAAWPLADAPDVLRFWREFTASAPESLASAVVLRFAPPAPFLPREVHGAPMVGVVVCFIGSEEEGEHAIEPVRTFGSPLAVAIGMKPFRAHQQLLDAAQPHGRRYYWKSEYVGDLTDATIDAIIAAAGDLPGPHAAALLFHLGGAARRVPEGATAAANRDAEYLINYMGSWEAKADTERHIGWARSAWRQIVPFSMGTYVNFLTDDADEEQVRTSFGANWDRLARTKARFDPDNLFRPLQNVRPSA